MSSPAAAPKIVKSQLIRLSDAGLSESELEKMIADDPKIVGLGDLILKDRQRQQQKGRLDLLLEDREGESRFEVEIQLGSLDESHLVRTIEYWDIERRKYPGYTHCAVVIAEDITSRFLNVIQLFSGSIPIIAIQVNVHKVGDVKGLSFIKLVDSRTLREDDQLDLKAKSTTREDWLKFVGQSILSIADECLAVINSDAKRKRSLNYTQQYIGLTEDGKANNFVAFSPMKSRMRVHATLSPIEPWVKRLETSNVDFKQEGDRLIIDVTTQAFTENKDLIEEVLREAVKQDEA